MERQITWNVTSDSIYGALGISDARAQELVDLANTNHKNIIEKAKNNPESLTPNSISWDYSELVYQCNSDSEVAFLLYTMGKQIGSMNANNDAKLFMSTLIALMGR